WLLLFKLTDRSIITAFVASTGLASLLFLPWYVSIQSYFISTRHLYNYPGPSEVLTAPFFDVSLGGATMDPQASADMVVQKLYSYLGVIRWTVGIFWTLLLIGIYLAFRQKGSRIFRANLSLVLMVFFVGISASFAAVYIQNYYFAPRQFLFFSP